MCVQNSASGINSEYLLWFLVELIFGDSSHAPDGVRVMYARNESGNSALAVLDLLGADAGHVAFPAINFKLLSFTPFTAGVSKGSPCCLLSRAGLMPQESKRGRESRHFLEEHCKFGQCWTFSHVSSVILNPSTTSNIRREPMPHISLTDVQKWHTFLIASSNRKHRATRWLRMNEWFFVELGSAIIV